MPVLCDEPDARESGERRSEVVIDASEHDTRRERQQDRAAQVPLVQPEPDHVQACPERMPLDADESSVGPLQDRSHSDLIGTNGRRA